MSLQTWLCPYCTDFWKLEFSTQLHSVCNALGKTVSNWLSLGFPYQREGSLRVQHINAVTQDGLPQPSFATFLALTLVFLFCQGWYSEQVFGGTVRHRHFPFFSTSPGFWWRVSSLLPNLTFLSCTWLVSYQKLIYPDCHLFNTWP